MKSDLIRSLNDTNLNISHQWCNG